MFALQWRAGRCSLFTEAGNKSTGSMEMDSSTDTMKCALCRYSCCAVAPGGPAGCSPGPSSPCCRGAAEDTAGSSDTRPTPRQQQQDPEQQGQQRRRFSQELWARVEGGGAFGAILEHPFLRGLMDGSLPEPCFRHYIAQDVLYLRWVQAGQGGGCGAQDALYLGYARSAGPAGWVLALRLKRAPPVAPDRQRSCVRARQGSTGLQAWGLARWPPGKQPPNLRFKSRSADMRARAASQHANRACPGPSQPPAGSTAGRWCWWRITHHAGSGRSS